MYRYELVLVWEVQGMRVELPLLMQASALEAAQAEAKSRLSEYHGATGALYECAEFREAVPLTPERTKRTIRSDAELAAPYRKQLKVQPRHTHRAVDLALRYGDVALAERIVAIELSGEGGWGERVSRALVEGLGARRCVGHAYRICNKGLAFHLSIHHKSELSDKERAVLGFVILYGLGVITADGVVPFGSKMVAGPDARSYFMVMDTYQPDAALVRRHRARARARTAVSKKRAKKAAR